MAGLVDEPVIQSLAGCSDEAFKYLSPVAQITVSICKEIVAEAQQKAQAQERHTQKPVYIE